MSRLVVIRSRTGKTTEDRLERGMEGTLKGLLEGNNKVGGLKKWKSIGSYEEVIK